MSSIASIAIAAMESLLSKAAFGSFWTFGKRILKSLAKAIAWMIAAGFLGLFGELFAMAQCLFLKNAHKYEVADFFDAGGSLFLCLALVGGVIVDFVFSIIIHPDNPNRPRHAWLFYLFGGIIIASMAFVLAPTIKAPPAERLDSLYLYEQEVFWAAMAIATILKAVTFYSEDA